ncbi:hypothetical protein MLD38_017898 [Melastoma candidum]|uniref:Uncharacterized protein n=1 Tax=Melastoma candidum TaxID=119954 RepID=A0ACB9QU24_9MYRT|nr:hypothetical protein MLD38_017898 [Melastoma candidum]
MCIGPKSVQEKIHWDYQVTGSKNELGVVSAESTASETMIPINWTEMQCPLAGQIKKRKVAKVSSQNGIFLSMFLQVLQTFPSRCYGSFSCGRELES